MVYDVSDIERRLNAGGDDAWLRPGEVAALLGVGRTKVHEMLNSGTIGYRIKAGGIQRRCNPDDVTRLLSESRREHRAPNDPNRSGE
jgi:excisionase family DNA binding protein